MPYPLKLSEADILAAAADIVDRDGIEALSMRTLAERLGVRASSLYRYYPDKEHLVRAVSAGFLTELADAVQAQITLRGMGTAYWDYGVRHPNRYRVIVRPGPERELPPEQVRFQVTEPLHDVITRIAPAQHLELARVLWSYLHGAVSLRLAWPTRPGLDPEAAFQAGLAVFEEMLRAPSPVVHDGERS